MPAKPRSFVGRVRATMDALSATERRLAEFVLEFPGDLASYTAAELGKLANVSNATVSRFFRHLGYSSYEEARRHVRDDKKDGAALLLTGADAGQDEQGVAAHAQLGIANLTRTFAELSDAMLDEIAGAVVGAQQVLVFGFRSSQAFASYFRWQILQVVERVIALPGPGETLGEHLVGLDRKSVVIVFGLRRRVPQTDAVIEYAARAGARVLYVTDRSSPARAGATWTIICETSAPGPLDNHVAVLGVCGALATKVFQQASSQGRKRLSGIESAHDALGEM
ncbi:SIS domain protein [Paraburkholderia xenovorans LB400]|uniref:Transcriptional regulator, RpiR family n=1 Tax=Paraburkholderia xenovorans (strain LB400) TaxID=266265 RepID=Q13FP6_PARXL|nr:MurR/RpiR family transcriptional regulator [Paraburkholderia xenovorans]ABE37093.1 transcriptional regulator, RpiR family [Paraburkholderia xenovorans LB400]AIP34496.1 SIS domain protein [Paraburkholderia xenovorans LB400]